MQNTYSTAPNVAKETSTMNVLRDERGRLLPGTPPVPGSGRKTKAQEDAYLVAIKAAMTPEQLTEALQTALDLAIELKSPRAILVVVEVVANYGLGKPTQTVIKRRDSSKDALIAALLQDDNDPLLPAADGTGDET